MGLDGVAGAVIASVPRDCRRHRAGSTAAFPAPRGGAQVCRMLPYRPTSACSWWTINTSCAAASSVPWPIFPACAASARPRAARRPSSSRGALRPDVVLMDLRMPGIGGLEAARRIGIALPATRIIAVTAWDSEPPQRLVPQPHRGLRGQGRARAGTRGDDPPRAGTAPRAVAGRGQVHRSNPFDLLTSREMQVCMLLLAGRRAPPDRARALERRQDRAHLALSHHRQARCQRRHRARETCREPRADRRCEPRPCARLVPRAGVARGPL